MTKEPMTPEAKKDYTNSDPKEVIYLQLRNELKYLKLNNGS